MLNDAAILESARAMRPFLTERAARTEANRRIGDDIIEALREARILSTAVPKRWGGLGATVTTIAHVGAELAKGCPSTAWVYWVLSTGTWLASVAPDAVQEDVFAGSLPLFCGSGKPGIATPVGGGYRVNGKWDYLSGCYNANWGMFFVDVEQTDGTKSRGRAFIRMKDLVIEETWRSVGMTGTGSHTSVAANVFVPAHMIIVGPMSLGPSDPLQKHVGEDSDYWPALSMLRSTLLGPLVGIAQVILELVSARMHTRGFQFTSYTRQIDSPVAQHAVGKAAAKIETARILMERGGMVLDDAARNRRITSYAERAQLKGQASLAIEMLAEATEKLMFLAGSSAFDERNDLQRYWRDFSVALRHPNIIPDIGFEIYGRAMLGVEPNLLPQTFI